jgi:hypothetical protein
MANFARPNPRTDRHLRAVACLAFVGVQAALCWLALFWVGRDILTRLMIGM